MQQSTALIEGTLESLGIFARVSHINIIDDFYEYLLEIAVGANLEELEKHDRDLALVLASPTGKVYWQIPIPGKALVGLRVPKPTSEYFEKMRDEDKASKRPKDLRSTIAFVFFLIGDANHSIARRILGTK